jgi:hypothetical protein
MPKFEVTIEREVPSFRERATVVIEADDIEQIEQYFEPHELDYAGVELEWETVMEGHGGWPMSYDINYIDPVDPTIPVDAEVQKVFDECFEEAE